MTRLNVSMRKDMATKALAVAGTDAELTALVTRRATLAEAIRVDALGGLEGIAAIEKAAKSIKAKMANDIFNKVSGFRVKLAEEDYDLNHINLGGMRVTLQFSGQTDAWPSDTRVMKCPIPISSTINHPADSEFTIEFLAVESDYKALMAKREGIYLQVKAALDPFTTVKKLLEAWPEAEELLPDDIDETKPQLPAILTKDLNCLIGLPQS